MKIMQERRAVAPIIATLLMVAISVVGGILIFVFAQDFFTSSNVQGPGIDSLQIFGYDATDGTGLTAHTAVSITSVGTLNQKLGDSDAFAVYIRNTGASPVVIETVKVFGSEFSFDTDASTSAISSTIPGTSDGVKEWLLTKGNATSGNPKATGSQVIQAGEEVTMVIAYDTDVNGDIKIGRPIPVVIKTGNAATFTKQIENGVRIG